jgi:tetratricopeptide (TPR) repeat protein
LSQAVVWVREGRFARAAETLDALMAANRDAARRAEIIKIRLSLLSASGRYREVLDQLSEHRELLQQVLPPVEFWTLWSNHKIHAHEAFADYDAVEDTLSKAEQGLGEPFNRFMALDRMRRLIETDGPVSEMERQLQRLRFFEDNYSYGGMLAIVRWGEALARAHSGATSEAVAIMREALDQYRASGLSLNMGAVEHLDLELARLLRADRQSAEAKALLDDLLHRHPTMAEARWERIELARQTGDDASLRTHLDALLAQWDSADPELPRLQQAIELRAGL